MSKVGSVIEPQIMTSFALPSGALRSSLLSALAANVRRTLLGLPNQRSHLSGGSFGGTMSVSHS